MMIEKLESRIAPAGVVTVLIAGTTVSISGDATANEITLSSDDGLALHVEGVGGTQLKVDSVPFSGSVIFPQGSVRNIRIALGDGSDAVNLVSLRLIGNLSVDGGLGNNTIEVSDTAILGSLALLGKSGNDTVHFSPGTVEVTRDLTMHLGDGENVFDGEPTRLEVGGKFSFSSGSGPDLFDLHPTTFSVGGDFTSKAGTGINTIKLRPATSGNIGGKATLSIGDHAAGTSTIALEAMDQFAIRGDLKLAGGGGDDTVSVTIDQAGEGRFSVGGKTSVLTGTGTDSVSFFGRSGRFGGDLVVRGGHALTASFVYFDSSLIGGGLSYTGGSGPDNFFWGGGGPLGVAGKTTVNLGAGLGQAIQFGPTTGTSSFAGSVLLSASNASIDFLDAAVLSTLTIRTGSGSDTIDLENVTLYGRSFIDSGAGDDFVNIDISQKAGPTVIFGSMLLQLGDGEDRVQFGDSGADSKVQAEGAVTVDGGRGSDTLDYLTYGNTFAKPPIVRNVEATS